MIYENIVIQYAPIEANDILRKEKADDQKYINLIETLKSLRELDPEAYDELIEAMMIARGDKTNLYSVNLFLEFGLADNPAITRLIERQERILAIVRSNKDVDSILKAVDILEKMT